MARIIEEALYDYLTVLVSSSVTLDEQDISEYMTSLKIERGGDVVVGGFSTVDVGICTIELIETVGDEFLFGLQANDVVNIYSEIATDPDERSIFVGRINDIYYTYGLDSTQVLKKYITLTITDSVQTMANFQIDGVTDPAYNGQYWEQRIDILRDVVLGSGITGINIEVPEYGGSRIYQI
jgi:hypothetical protein